ncbi:MAG: hypothetical protein H5T69_10685 [Chloroflexi bacterium]|nr:hypothetical protein [Chloroflexota bacterium]
MDSRERVRMVLDGQVPDRIPLDDSYWVTTVARWRREGLPADVDPRAYFGTDEIVFLSGDYSMRFPERELERTELSRTYWDADGALRRDLHTDEGWTSQWLDFTIKTPDDWERERGRLAFVPERIPENILATYREARRRGRFVCYAAHAAFHPTWMRIGMENELVLMIEAPDWIHDMMAAHTRLIIELFEQLRALGIEFDGARLADDLGYQSAPLISPRLYHEVVLPHHKCFCDHLRAAGLKTMLHSDGNVAPLIPEFLEAGFVGLHPLEAKAGLDVRQLKPQYGDRLVLWGNIDVRALAGTREEIEEEIVGKIEVAKQGGGYIYHSDHSVPNNVSLENYRYALDLVRRVGSYER